ncbi:hypothetical protein KOW79_006931, partial [Hemibagrus wyckioides]
MELSPLSVMLLLVSLIPVFQAQVGLSLASLSPIPHSSSGDNMDISPGTTIAIQHALRLLHDELTTAQGESPPVSLIINPSRTQHFTNDSLSLSCEDQSNSTGWTVRRYTHSERVLDCSHWGSVTGSTCNISFLSTSYTGVYWCESESGENSNPVNITVHDGDVILESPVHPVTEGHPLTLRCLYHNPNPSNLRADFYKDGSVLQNQTTGEMIIQTVSKSDEGFYHCKHPERGESPKSWISVRLLISLIPVAQAQGSPKAVVSIIPDTHVFIGETVTLRCDIQGGGDTQWTYSWKKNNYRFTEGGERFSTDSTMQEFKISSVNDSDSGTYTCRGHGRDSQSSEISDAVTLTVSAKPKPTVRVNPQSFVYTGDTVTLSCELQQGTGWGFQWNKNNQRLWNLHSEQENTLKVTVDNAGETEYQCRADRRNYYTYYFFGYYYSTEFSDPVKITVKERPQAVLSVSPQSWLTEGDSVTLSCEVTDSSTDWTFSWYTVVPYRDGLTGINNNGGYSVYVELLSDSSRGSGGNYTLSPAALKHTGVYMCRGERGEPALHSQYSNPQPLWITGHRSSGLTVGLVVGLGFFFIALLILVILLWSCKRKKEKQQKTNQTSDQNQIRSGAEDSQSGHTPLQAESAIYANVDDVTIYANELCRSGKGEAAAESNDATYAQVKKKKKTNRNNGADADVTYAEIELKPAKKAKRVKGKASVDDDTVYSELKHNRE